MMILAAFLTLFYTSILVYHLIGWERTGSYKAATQNKSSFNLRYSIIIPVRNEAANIEACIHNLMEQQFPPEQFEVLIADDHSDDDTCARVNQLIPKYGNRLQLLRMDMQETHASKSYKKQAITHSIGMATGQVIITSDADCTRPPGWLATMASFFESNNLVMVSAPVIFNGNSIFEKMQSLEFSGLIGIGGAAIKMGTPNMCNGANLCYLKEAFYEVGGYKGNEHISSGDDEFLMHKLFKRYPGKVQFLKSVDAMVTTSPEKQLNGFVRQRKRWVSKSTHYNSFLVTFLMALVYGYNLSLILSFAAGVNDPQWFSFFLLQAALKTAAEGIFLWRVLRVFGQTNLLLYLIPAQPLHVLYVLYIGIAGNMGTYEWKGRTVR